MNIRKSAKIFTEYLFVWIAGKCTDTPFFMGGEKRRELLCLACRLVTQAFADQDARQLEWNYLPVFVVVGKELLVLHSFTS